MEGEDAAEIKRQGDALTQASHKLAEAMYRQTSQADTKQAETRYTPQSETSAKEDDVVDAEFEEM